MSLPSIEYPYQNGKNIKPLIYVIHVFDPEKNKEPIASIILERREKFAYLSDQTVSNASIRISYELMTGSRNNHGPRGGEFCGSYSRDYEGRELVSITSPSMAMGALSLNLHGMEGCRIGTYLMNEIVMWAKQWPNANLRSITLAVGQSYGENKVRRNRFYQQFGIEFCFVDLTESAGVSKPMTAQQLTPNDKWKARIKEVSLMDCIATQLEANLNLTFELDGQRRGKQWYKEAYDSACASPGKFFMRQLWCKYQDKLIVLSVFFGIAATLWYKY